ncbi:hypothetical protein PG995_004828 [Apiospora arundinis]
MAPASAGPTPRPTGNPGHDPRSGFPLPCTVSGTRPTMSCRIEMQSDHHAGMITRTLSTNQTSFCDMMFRCGALCPPGRIAGSGLCSSRARPTDTRVVRSFCGNSLNRSGNHLLPSVLTTSITSEQST